MMICTFLPHKGGNMEMENSRENPAIGSGDSASGGGFEAGQSKVLPANSDSSGTDSPREGLNAVPAAEEQTEDGHQIIGGTYEIIKKIGAGGAGVVYLGRHVRLNKEIVLKADKRKLSTKPEVLRREVDALKNLSHSYIPQVYDFIQENDTVYTVMDYIEGESLDKPLERGERIPQPQLIEWGCQLLEALVYLHSRPPHGILHSDIKPANIMVTPQNDIKLIDFNIALALGEEGSVRVGFSRGYASPEHYGLDFTPQGNLTRTEDATVLTEEGATWSESQRSKTGSTTGNSTSSGKKTVLLDVRSDIYSAGATLYHLLTGVRPPQDARTVQPINDPAISPAVAEIIMKAMKPNPEERYQTAAEMLYAFEHLHENDPRTRRRKRKIAVTAAVLAACFVLGGGTAFAGQRIRTAEAQKAQRVAELREQVEAISKEAQQLARSTLESIDGSRSSLAAGDRPGAVAQALSAVKGDALAEGRRNEAMELYISSELETLDPTFPPPAELDGAYASQAQYALTDALGVYDLSSGFRASRTLELPSTPLKAGLSPGGTKAWAIYSWELAVYDAATGEQIVALPVERSAHADAVFPSEDVVIYAGAEGITAWDLRSDRLLWQGEKATKLSLSGDAATVAAVFKDAPAAYVYDAGIGELLCTVDFGGRGQRMDGDDIYIDNNKNMFALNGDGNLLAVSFSNGSADIYSVPNGSVAAQLLEPSAYTRINGGFCEDWIALCASGGGEQAIFAAVDLTNPRRGISAASDMPFQVQTAEDGILLANENKLTLMDIHAMEQREIAFTAQSDVSGFFHAGDYTVVCTNGDNDKSYSFFGPNAQRLSRTDTADTCDFVSISGGTALAASRNSQTVRLLTLDEHREAEMFRYDPAIFHTEARLSGDGQRVMLYSRAKYHIYDIGGELVAEGEFPEDNQIYDQQYRRDGGGSWLEVTYYDGTVVSYSGSDGTILSETMIPAPSGDLEEDFFSDHLRIHRSPHQPPQVFEREGGAFRGELERDVDMTYLTQVGDYIIVEYITTTGERFGVLMNEDLETLARLPNLCDIVNDTLVFDYPTGDLRTSPIYSLEELMELAEG